MKLVQLEYFVTLAHELHFRRAAARLGITQAPLSQAIQALEADVGARLFNRNRRSVELTEAGRILLLDAQAILQRALEARNRIHRVVQGEAGHLRIGLTASASLHEFFPRVIQAYRTRYPEVSLSLHELASSQQLRALESGEIDLGVLRRPAGAVPAGLVFTRIVDDGLMVVVNRKHRLARAGTVRIADIAREPLIIYPRSSGISIHDQILQMYAGQGFTPKIVQEAREALTIIGLVAAGLGLAIVPASLRRVQIEGVAFLRFAGRDAHSAISLVRRYGEANSRVNNFQSLLNAHLRAAGAARATSR